MERPTGSADEPLRGRPFTTSPATAKRLRKDLVSRRLGKEIGWSEYTNKEMTMTSMHAARISVAVTHPEEFLAAGIAALLRASAEFAVGVQAGPDGTADVVVTDYAAGVDRPPIGAYRPGAKTSRRVVVTGRSGAWQIRRAIDSGVRGYLLDDCTSVELAEAVR